MTLDEAIKHCLEVAEQNDFETRIYDELNKSGNEEYRNNHCQCAADHRQLAEWLTELKEAKRLLKAAVEDIHELLCDKKNLDGNGQSCNICSYIEWCPCCKECTIREDLRNWRYADEALALIGEDTNVPASADDTNVGHKSGGWISCEDRLPSENTLVLCYARSTTGEGNGYFLGGLALGEFWFLKVNDIGHVSYPVPHWQVTYWQPLPEPPKDGEQNG